MTPWRRTLVTVIALKLALGAVMYLGWYVLPYASYPGQDLWMVRPGNSFVTNLANFDGAWYVRIAHVGYRHLWRADYDYAEVARDQPVWDERGRREGTMGFGFRQFPAYAAVLKATAVLTGRPILAGVIVTNLIGVALALMLYRIAAWEWGETAGHWAALWSVLVPGGAFFLALYSEGLYLLAVGTSLYLARRGRWGWACLPAAVAATTRIYGITIVPALAVEWWLQRRRPHGDAEHSARPTLVHLSAAAAAALIPFAAYIVWVATITGEPFIFVTIHKGYDNLAFTWPWTNVWNALWTPETRMKDIPVLFGAVGVVALTWTRLPWCYRTFAVLALITILPYSLQSVVRHSLHLYVPVLALGVLTRDYPLLGRTAAFASAMVCAFYGVLFINGYWVG